MFGRVGSVKEKSEGVLVTIDETRGDRRICTRCGSSLHLPGLPPMHNRAVRVKERKVRAARQSS